LNSFELNIIHFQSDIKGKLQLRINGFSEFAGLTEKKWIYGKQVAYINKLPIKISACIRKSDTSEDVDLGIFPDFKLIDEMYSSK
jgi:hypothetical protein